MPVVQQGLTVTTTGIMDHINLSPYIKQRLWKVLNSAPPKVPS
jgi:hypothetical protein